MCTLICNSTIQNKMNNHISSSPILQFLLSIGWLFLVLFFQNCHPARENIPASTSDLMAVEDKQKGAHVFSIRDTIDFPPLRQNNIKWITMVCWAFQEDYNSPLVVHHHNDSLQIIKHDSNWVHRIELARAAGFKVFFKPHLWINDPPEGKWRSDIFPSNEEDWVLWQKSYRDFIIRYAKVAERAKADMFCVGVEFTRLALEKPMFWKQLILELRTVYSGQLTYAANWYEEFEQISFWRDLDFIGVQAYFPLADIEHPSVAQVSEGWNKYLPNLEAVHQKHKRKIIFTEMGYRSTSRSAMKPWEWVEDPSSTNQTSSVTTQANCYQAFFDQVWEKDWFAGVHIWQLRSDFAKNPRAFDLDFTPQGKPAANIIAKYFQ